MTADRAAPWLQLAAAFASALGVVWQRLFFSGVVGLPPPILAATLWLLLLAALALHHASGQSERRLLAWLTLAAATDYLWHMGLPAFGPGPGPEEVRWQLAGFLSTSWYGLPIHALLAATGLLAWAWLSARLDRARLVARGTGIVILLFGATTVLGYATGSPWPFGV
jgi:hypothetical protein